jgi:prephenate dehydrogenase
MGTLAIVGVGMMGGSLALAARARGLFDRIVGIDPNPEARQKACRNCALDAISDTIASAAQEWAGDRDQLTMVFCTPVDRVVEQVLAAAPWCSPNALLTDVGSTKANIIHDLENALPPQCRFIGSHPLAGSEKSGACHAQKDLFDGRVVVITPTSKTSAVTLQEARSFWQAFGAQVVQMTPEDHDEALARTSHLPHLIAAALANGITPELRSLAANGFRDTTRIAAGDVSLWSVVFLHNRGPILHALTALEDELDRFRAALRAGDRGALDLLLTQAKRNRDALGS